MRALLTPLDSHLFHLKYSSLTFLTNHEPPGFPACDEQFHLDWTTSRSLGASLSLRMPVGFWVDNCCSERSDIGNNYCPFELLKTPPWKEIPVICFLGAKVPLRKHCIPVTKRKTLSEEWNPILYGDFLAAMFSFPLLPSDSWNKQTWKVNQRTFQDQPAFPWRFYRWLLSLLQTPVGKYITIFEALCRWVSLAVGVFHVDLHTWRIWTRQCAYHSQTNAFILFKQRSGKITAFPTRIQSLFQILGRKTYIPIILNWIKCYV